MRRIAKFLTVPLAALAIYSGWQVWITLGNYRAEAELIIALSLQNDWSARDV